MKSINSLSEHESSCNWWVWFFGRSIVAQLLARGDAVHVIARRCNPDLSALGCVFHQSDLARADNIAAALQGADVVFHVAARAGIWGRWDNFYRDNVIATQKILHAAICAQVPKFVYTSSPSVVMGSGDLSGADESIAYPDRYLSHYPHTKSIAEKLVLAQRDMLTVALRPHLIWGPNDPHLVPRLLARARAGRLVRIGDGKNQVDVTYVDNAALAHLQAADSLGVRPNVSGRAYFIGQAEPVYLWQFIDQLIVGAGLRPIHREMGARFAMACSTVLEGIHVMARIQREPMLTRFMVAQLSASHWFNHAAAARDLGYVPVVSTEEGLRRTIAWLNSCSAHPAPLH